MRSLKFLSVYQNKIKKNTYINSKLSTLLRVSHHNFTKMRIYKADGTYTEDTADTEFGWKLSDIVIDEGQANYEEINRETKLYSKLKKTMGWSSISMDSIAEEDDKELKIEKYSPQIEMEPILETEDCESIVEGPNIPPTEERPCENVDIDMPSKEDLIKLINPCNSETKMLLAVIFYSKYRNLVKEEASEELLKSVNMKATNFKCLMGDCKTNIAEEMYQEIQNYHATKEDKMLSLMMELILTDVECDMEDIVSEQSDGPKPNLPQFVLETSDLGNSIPSSSSSKGEYRNSSPLHKENKDYLHVSNRSNILSSIGLSEEDRSLQNFCEETYEMHKQLAEIRKSFQEDENRVDRLIKEAIAYEKEIKEALHLDDILHLLKGDTEKVKLKKLPFKIFYDKSDDTDAQELNLII